MAGLIDRAPSRAEVAGEGHAARTEQQAGGVGEHIAEHVRCDHHVQFAWAGNQLIGGVVDFKHLPCHARPGGKLFQILLPQRADGGDAVRLQRQRQPAAPPAGQIKCRTQNPLYLAVGVGAMLNGGTVFPRQNLRSAEVESSGVFAHHDQIDAAQPFRSQDSGIIDCGKVAHRGQLAIEGEACAQVVHKSAAARSAENRAVFGEDRFAEFDNTGGQCGTAFRERRPPYLAAETDVGRALRLGANAIKHVARGTNHFGADAFAGQYTHYRSRCYAVRSPFGKRGSEQRGCR